MNESENDKKTLTEASLEQAGAVAAADGGSVVDDLMYAELLRPFEETVMAHFSGRESVVYRSVSIPAQEGDIKPRKLREYESVAQAEAEYELPPIEELEDWERLKILNHHFGSSVFTKEEGLRAMWMKGLSTKKTPSDKRRYKEGMGMAMVRLRIDAEAGLLQNAEEEREDGHLNFLPSNTFKIEEHIDQEYGYNGYMPFLYEDIKKLRKDEEGE